MDKSTAITIVNLMFDQLNSLDFSQMTVTELYQLLQLVTKIKNHDFTELKNKIESELSKRAT